MESHLLNPQDLLMRCRNSILNLLHTRNIHVSQLAREVNVPQPTMYRLLKGKTDDIKLSTLIAIADFFSVTIEDLIKSEQLHTIIKTPALLSYRNIPIITWKDAVSFSHAVSPEKMDVICTNTIFSEKTFALRAKASFEPALVRDTLLIIDPKVDPIDGDYVIVSYAGSGESTVRLLVLDGPITQLKKINCVEEPEPIRETIIVGPVLQSVVIHRKV